jgi:hypothetical protein
MENDAFMEYKGMNLHYKRFRSKAPSAASLPPGRLVSVRTKRFDFLLAHYYDTSPGGEGEKEPLVFFNWIV